MNTNLGTTTSTCNILPTTYVKFEMANLKGNDLMAIGFEPGAALGVALRLIKKHYHPNEKREVILETLQAVLNDPSSYVEHEVFGALADALTPKVDTSIKKLNAEPVPFRVYGDGMIEKGAMEQMRTAARLPVSVRGAIMPDGHAGYGLPIGGVLATEGAIIPYGVGVDIGCRMALTIYEASDNYIDRHVSNLKQHLETHTKFGMREVHDTPSESPVLDRSEFEAIPFLRRLKDKAHKQLGTSGSGNHFTSYGEVEILTEAASFAVSRGRYLGILSHSGSRGLGATVAKYYTDLAMKQCVLPPEAKHLAWLDLNTQEGQEYWLAMNLCGDYASACHHDIHKRLAKAIGMRPIATIENHHNFAWKEVHDGRELIVHRKGATPAGKGVLGIIPGSMATEAFIVQGTGNPDSLESASHGAGRLMSRTQARNSFSKKKLHEFLEAKRVTLIGAGVDESPMAYKDIHTVMSHQTELVEVLGTFFPRVVRMDDNKDESTTNE